MRRALNSWLVVLSLVVSANAALAADPVCVPMGPRAHATVICLVGQQIGDPKKIPGWLQQQHCSDDTAPTAQVANGLTRYQQLLLDAAGDATPACTGVLMDYFTGLNSPAGGGVSEPGPGPAVRAQNVGSGLAPAR